MTCGRRSRAGCAWSPSTSTGQASTTLDDRLRVADEWEPGGGVAFAVDVEGDLRGNYWWLSAFADFDGHAWSRADTTTDDVAALAPIDVPPDASGAGPFDVSVTVTPRRSTPGTGHASSRPSEPQVVSRAVRVRSLGDREGLTEITFADEVLRGASYRVTSAVHDYQAWRRRADGLAAARRGHRLPGLDRPLPASGRRCLRAADRWPGRARSRRSPSAPGSTAPTTRRGSCRTGCARWTTDLHRGSLPARRERARVPPAHGDGLLSALREHDGDGPARAGTSRPGS